jgi:hypothetical protein
MNYLPEFYAFEFLLERKEDSFKEQLQEELRNILDDAKVTVKDHSSEHAFFVSISGTLETIDKCYENLVEFLKTKELEVIYLKDEAGDEIRSLAYPILARIEQSLRSFINNALIDVYGFKWWANLPSSIGKENERNILQPLENSYFEDLITIITYECSEWPEDKGITVTDFCELLSSCNSIEDIQAKVEGKIRKISLWDSVFSKYFEGNAKTWRRVSKILKGKGSVISIRNEVMHHRRGQNLRLSVIKRLEETQKELESIFKLAKDKLSEEERVEAQEKIQTVTLRVKRNYELADIAAAVSNSLNAKFSTETLEKMALPTVDKLRLQTFLETLEKMALSSADKLRIQNVVETLEKNALSSADKLRIQNVAKAVQNIKLPESDTDEKEDQE